MNRDRQGMKWDIRKRFAEYISYYNIKNIL